MARQKPVMVVGVDDNPHSLYALEWTLDHFFTPPGSNHPFQLVLIHAQPLPSSVLGLAGPASADVMPIMEVNIKKTATRIVDKVQELCKSKSLNDAKVEVLEGEAKRVMCEAVAKYNATILVLGSRGYGAVKRAILGSVSDYCAHNAQCSVMIVKEPKT